MLLSTVVYMTIIIIYRPHDAQDAGHADRKTRNALSLSGARVNTCTLASSVRHTVLGIITRGFYLDDNTCPAADPTTTAASYTTDTRGPFSAAPAPGPHRVAV